jgi:hypothetical protein
MTLTHKSRIVWISLIVACCFDFLFWQHSDGINFFIFVVLCLIGGFLISAFEKNRPAVQSLVLVPLILYFAGMFAFRSEPMTKVLNTLATLCCMALLVSTFTGGRWLLYSLSDYFVRGFQLVIGIPAKAFSLLFMHHNPSPVQIEGEDSPAPAKKKNSAWSIVRGVILALPILLILAALLASADPVFSKMLGNLLNIFNIDRLGEYVFRAVYIVFFAFLFCGIFTYALAGSNDEKLLGLDKPWMPPFLGWTEAAIVLGSIDVLFAVFVGVQFRYFFGGRANVVVDGFTFAEYARKGFSELVWVAIISLLVMLLLSTITRKVQENRQTAFSWLCGGLVAQVAVILVSAFQRLLLYEDAYGFSRIRTYTHVFMIWLGILLVAVLVLEITRHQRAFALAGVVVCAGFVMTLNFLNVDGFITRMNIARAADGSELDIPYLVTLSSDSVPEVAAIFTQPGTSADLHGQMGAVLACRSGIQPVEPVDTDWRSITGSEWQAKAVMDSLTAQLKGFTVKMDSGGWHYVTVNGKDVYCESNSGYMD